ncbi:hypothetical protein ACI2K4_29075 [Micromonospora sp. NPDC050397]|uniref:hypothetical protein n=1 Tax=Micromonospora sp. NPDC050397 TaxID=3364279 RepID=UPI00384FBD85
MTRRLLRLVAAVTVVLIQVPVAAAPATAAPLPIGQCTTSSGVILAVDFSDWGGPLLRSCGTTPTTGYTLLNQGGWQTTGTGHDGPAFICRIGYSGHEGGKQYPTPDDEACVFTPPASAYWSYWHADPGQNTWSYSQLGAMSYRPNPGSVDLWIFGGTDIGGTTGGPTFSPDSVRARNTTPVGDTKPTAAPPRTASANPQPGATTAVAPPQNGSPTPDLVTSPPADASASPSAPALESPSASASVTSGPVIVDAAPAAEARTDSGSATPVLIGVGLILILGAAGGYTAWRRRRTP